MAENDTHPLRCVQCGSTGGLIRVGEGVFRCRSCLSDSFARCPECGRYVRKEDLSEYDPGYCGRDILLCKACAEKYGY